jgi:aminoglycoside phosphotransferase (APT) family kinase protein
VNGAADGPTRPGTRPVSERHRFDEGALAAWLERSLADFAGPAIVHQFAEGQSNPTFHVAAASGEYVVRKKPPGDLLPSAHAVDREYRVLEALADSGVPVPAVRAFCADETVIGTPFYVMDFKPGRIVTDVLLPELDAADRAAVYDSMNQSLASLHLVDWKGRGLETYGRPDGYFTRQVDRWTRQYEKTRVEDVPALDSLRGWVTANIPDDDTAAIVHGDYRLGNLILHPIEPRVVAVLDWELSTIGHPLADLAYNCMTYHLPVNDPIAAGFVGADVELLAGIPSETAYLEAYAARTGRDPGPLWRFCMAFSLYRAAAIQLGVYVRSRQGNAASETAALFGKTYRMVADAGWRFLSGS